MNQTVKNFFTSCLGTLAGMALAFALAVIITIGVITAMVSNIKDGEKVEMEANSILELRLDYTINERTSGDPFKSFDFGSLSKNDEPGLNEVLEAIDNAKEDENIEGIYLNVSVIPNGLATIEAIRNQLIEFKESGKFIIAYSEQLTQKAYYLSTVADDIYINPEGYMEFTGFSYELMFLKGMLDKLEVEPKIFYAGKFKSATEPFRFDKMSDPNREQVSLYLNDVYGHFLSQVSAERGVPVSTLEDIANTLKVRTPGDAVERGLIDKTMYEHSVLEELVDRSDVEDIEELKLVGLGDYLASLNPKGEDDDDEEEAGDKIAVLYAQGSIIDGEGEEDEIGSANYAATIREIRMDEDVKALVFRINSGGGSALASDVILKEIQLLAEKMPVVVSMGNVAASGGYYIACDADKIYAEPNTVTGSIGVFGLLPNTQKFFQNKLGITFDRVKTGEFADLMNPNRPMTAADSAIIQEGVDSVYITFKSRVAAGRGMTMEEVEEIAQGRIWTGIQALENGLVDELGGMDDALAYIVDEAGLGDDYQLVEYPTYDDPFAELFGGAKSEVAHNIVKEEMGEYYIMWEKLKEVQSMTGIQARLPYEFDIK